MIAGLTSYPITIKEKFNVCAMLENEEDIEDMIAFLVVYHPDLTGEEIVRYAEKISGLKRPLP